MIRDEQIPSKLDPGTPIDCPQTYFWVWIQAVRLYKDSSRGGSPLNSKADLFQHINRFYRPRPEAKTRPNPSFYLSKMKKLGMMRMFGERGAKDNFWAPETDIVLRVMGEIVYTPADLPELLAGGKRFLFDHAPEPDRPTKVPRARSPKNERVQAPTFEDVHQVLWSMAEPTSSMDERILSREAAIKYIVGVKGTNYAFAQLFLHGRLRAASEPDRVLVKQPASPLPSPPTPSLEMPVILEANALQLMTQEQLDAHRDTWATELTKAQTQLALWEQERERRKELAELHAQREKLEQRRRELDEEERALTRKLKELGKTG